MSLPRPVNFLLLCFGLLFVQQALSTYVTWQLWSPGGRIVHGTMVVALATGGVHALLLFAQLPRALRWRPRRTPRPSAEVTLERQRIARELHDRVGSQLVGALALFGSSQPTAALQREALEHALLELRLLVDTMNDADHTLVDRLAQLRHRLQPVFESQGITSEWDLSAIYLPGAPREPLLAVIAQEALSNVIQHARATRVAVSLQCLPERGIWLFEIRDNGRGLSESAAAVPAARAGGFGLHSMRERARQIGGELHVHSLPLGGTCLEVHLPLHH